ncbi:MAG: DnaJ domain-containing protein [Polyangia bacterium]
MADRDPGFDSYVLKIHEVLDRLDYYRLLGVKKSANNMEIKRSFLAIAAKFHPDRNRGAQQEIRTAIYEIFKRLNEGYRVLTDHAKRKRYDAGLSEGKLRLDRENRRALGPKTPQDTIKSREARQFYRQASEELAGGNLMQAELHIKVARSREPGNEAIEALWQKISEAKKNKKKK